MFSSAASRDQHLPSGVVVASFETHEQAQAAVSKVSEADAELAGLAIIGNDLKLVERVTGRLSWGRVALGGATRGLMFGAFLGLVYMLFVPEALNSVLLFPLLGLAFGILMGIVTHALTRRRRAYASVQQVLAARYDVVAPQEIAGKAMQVIGQRETPVAQPEPTVPQAQPEVPTHQAPPPAPETRIPDPDEQHSPPRP